MGISVRDTKILWGRAAGRCSLCRIELAVDVEQATETIHLGEQAHIVAEETDGPRGESSLSVEKRNSYHNLILLCANCHVVVDKAPAEFSAPRLHELKRAHEEWVKNLGLHSESLGLTWLAASPRFLLQSLAIVVLTGAAVVWELAPIGLLAASVIVLFEYRRHRQTHPAFGSSSFLQFASLVAIFCASAVHFQPPKHLLEAEWSPGGIHVLKGASWQVVAHAFLAALIVALSQLLDFRRQRKALATSRTNPLADASALDRADFPYALKRYCQALVAELDRYDREVNWSDHELTPLEAEVERERSSRSSGLIVRDLVEAIRRDRSSSVFVVLGDPGSGKSVSLRRLVRQLASQAAATGVVPVYVNLREYPTSEEPVPETIREFIRSTTARQTGRDGRAFLDRWYDRFRVTGRLFFVIDSFDELPAVLDCDDKSESHLRISHSFDRFFTQEVQSCRAVLASRLFRSPTNVAGTRLLIRPFTESQIRRALRLWLRGKGIDTEQYVKQLFQERPQLVPLLRNPFTAELIAEYALSVGGRDLPANMFAVFDSYIIRRLESDAPLFHARKLKTYEVRRGSNLIAEQMYSNAPNIGLEIEVKDLESALASQGVRRAREIIEALAYVRLARLGRGLRPQFSFVHRRFAEFFVVDQMRHTGWRMNTLSAIPTDSRWRDCLVLGCGILDQAHRAEVARYCWSVIEKTEFDLSNRNIAQVRAAVHCARFLTDAFRGDSEAVRSFGLPMGRLTLFLLASEDVLLAKLAAELIPLLPSHWQKIAISKSLRSRIAWIVETSLSACRHVGSIEPDAHYALRTYFKSIPLLEFLSRFKDLYFSLSLSEAFAQQRQALWLDRAELSWRVSCAVVFTIATSIYAPLFLLPVLLLGSYEWMRRHGNFDNELKYQSSLPSFDYKDYYVVVDPDVAPRASSTEPTITPPADPLGESFDRRFLHLIQVRDKLDAASYLFGCILPFIYCAWWAVQQLAYRLDIAIDIWPNDAAPYASPAVVVAITTSMVAAWCHWAAIPRFTGAKETLGKLTGELKALYRVGVVKVVVVCYWQALQLMVRLAVDSVRGAFSSERWDLESDMKDFLKLCALGLAGMVLLSAVIYGLLYFGVNPWTIAIVGAGILGTYAVARVTKSAIRFFKRSLARRRQRGKLSRMGVPNRLSCAELFANMADIREPSVAAEYLRKIRIRRVKLVGDMAEPPERWLVSAKLSEEYAKLREQWLGLER